MANCDRPVIASERHFSASYLQSFANHLACHQDLGWLWSRSCKLVQTCVRSLVQDDAGPSGDEAHCAWRPAWDVDAADQRRQQSGARRAQHARTRRACPRRECCLSSFLVVAHTGRVCACMCRTGNRSCPMCCTWHRRWCSSRLRLGQSRSNDNKLPDSQPTSASIQSTRRHRVVIGVLQTHTRTGHVIKRSKGRLGTVLSAPLLFRRGC